MIALLLLMAALAISLPLVRLLCRYQTATDSLQIFGKELIWRRLDDDLDNEDGERESLLSGS